MNDFARNLGSAEIKLLTVFWNFVSREIDCLGFEPLGSCPKSLFSGDSRIVRRKFMPLLKTRSGTYISYWASKEGDSSCTCLVYIPKNKVPHVLANGIAEFLSLILYGNEFIEQIIRQKNTSEPSRILEINQTKFQRFETTKQWLDLQNISTSNKPAKVIGNAQEAYPCLVEWLSQQDIFFN